jgi:multidrug efflux pump subunit AcrB
MSGSSSHAPQHDILSGIVSIFLRSNLSIMLILFSLVVGAAALLVTPREEDPQIVVPVADIYVQYPGKSAAEVEQLVSTPLERLLYQIDGVEYVYSMSKENLAIVTVRFYVGQDRERSLVKLFKKLNENLEIIPAGVSGWVMKPVEIDDVPIVTLTLKGAGGDSHLLRRVAEEAMQRLAAIPDVSRSQIIGGEERTVRVDLDPNRLEAYSLSPMEVEKALKAAHITLPGGEFVRGDKANPVESGLALRRADDAKEIVVGVFQDRPVFLKDVATVIDGPAEVSTYVRHSWGPARSFEMHHGSPGTILGGSRSESARGESAPATTIAFSKKKGTNAVAVADQLLKRAEELRHEVVPDDVEMVVSRNYGLTANEKVNDLVEALGVAILIVVALLTLSMGWRAAFVVAVAVPVVFGLTLFVNLLFGFTINRVTLFALILALGLLVDDPIVDVENIERHFEHRKAASPEIVLEAVAEIRPPLISATLAVIVSFLPMFFITGMMGPYMSPMALNVPISMLMSMVVAFTITPWLAYRVLGKTHAQPESPTHGTLGAVEDSYDPEELKKSPLYRFFKPLMAPLLSSRWAASLFLLIIAGLTVAAMGMAATRSVPLKMLPYDNKNELLLVLDFDEGTSLERSNAAVQQFETYLADVPEVVDVSSFVGTASPIDFNGLVRHYYLRQGSHLAELRVNFVGKRHRAQQSHAIGLRMRNELTALAAKHRAVLKIVELPPGPPVIASLVAEVYGRPDHSYEDLLAAGKTVEERFRREPGVGDVDSVLEAPIEKMVFVADQEKAALAGVSVQTIAATIRLAVQGADVDAIRVEHERYPLRVNLRMPRELRSSHHDLARIAVRSTRGTSVPLAELGRWEKKIAHSTIYHKNLERVAYVFGETAGRPPAECIADIMVDRVPQADLLESQEKVDRVGSGLISVAAAKPISQRTYFANGSGIRWSLPAGIRVDFAGEGEWKITLDVFRDLGLAFGAALLMIYVILVAQTGSFLIPVIVMMAIPLTVLGVMPGFWLLNAMSGGESGGFADPIYFTATAMIGMIALAGIVTRDSIILVDFIGQAVKRGRTLFEAIMESRVVRLRPILLTAGAAMLSSIPIVFDPIFSGLGWSLIFGLFAATLFTLFVIPVTYWLAYVGKTGGSESSKGSVS